MLHARLPLLISSVTGSNGTDPFPCCWSSLSVSHRGSQRATSQTTNDLKSKVKHSQSWKKIKHSRSQSFSAFPSPPCSLSCPLSPRNNTPPPNSCSFLCIRTLPTPALCTMHISKHLSANLNIWLRFRNCLLCVGTRLGWGTAPRSLSQFFIWSGWWLHSHHSGDMEIGNWKNIGEILGCLSRYDSNYYCFLHFSFLRFLKYVLLFSLRHK